jgi:hypothetical protein
MTVAVYVDQAEDEAREAALRQWRVKATPKPAAEAAPELLKLYADISAEQLAAPAPRDELIFATNKVMKVCLEVVAGVVADEARRTDKRVDAAGAKITALEATVAELTGQISDLVHRFERDLATRGVKDGQHLPASLVQRTPRAAPKRKPAGRT